jgi:hypothetical protein
MFVLNVVVIYETANALLPAEALTVARWSPFRKIRLWALYDPAKRVIVMSSPYKKYLSEPGRRSGQVIVELTGFYPATARDTGAEHD